MTLWLLAVAGSALVLTQSSLTEAMRTYLLRRAPVLGKLVSCPMCSGFWLGMHWWAAMLGARKQDAAHEIVRMFASGFAGSIVSALAVALWLALGEAYAALGLYRFLRSPGGPSDGRARIPKHMKPAYANHTPSLYVCACGETVTAGSAHVMGPRCEPPEA